MSEKSSSLNNVSLVGRAGSDPEVRYTNNQKMVCKLSIAVDTYGSEKPDWFELEVWGKTAEITSKFISKGSLFGLNGSLSQQTWQDRDTGANRSKVIVKVRDIYLMGSKSDNQNNQGGYQSQSQVRDPYGEEF